MTATKFAYVRKLPANKLKSFDDPIPGAQIPAGLEDNYELWYAACGEGNLRGVYLSKAAAVAGLVKIGYHKEHVQEAN